jgi:purine-binding chemotaxis protein CheW
MISLDGFTDPMARAAEIDGREWTMSMDMINRKASGQKKSLGVQLLTFKLDDQEYGLDVANVVQVVRMVALTRPPQVPDYVMGVFNLRGSVVPVIDIRRRCGLAPRPYDLDTQLLIARVDGHALALAVDVVSEVLTLPAEMIDSPDRIGPGMEFLSAVAKVDTRLVMILNPRMLMELPTEHAGELEKMEMAI